VKVCERSLLSPHITHPTSQGVRDAVVRKLMSLAELV
jgi:hypothetical protein